MESAGSGAFSYGFALLALLLLGIQRFFYKVAAEWECDIFRTTFAFMITVTGLSVLFFLFRGTPAGGAGFLVTVGAVNGLAFFAATTATMEALKHLPAGVVYPVARLNVLLVILFAVLFLGERLTVPQAVGIALALGVIALLTRREAQDPVMKRKNRARGLVFLGIALFSGALAAVSSKYAAAGTDPFAFMALSYGVGTVLSLASSRRRLGEPFPGPADRSLLLGLFMGLFNFSGFYCFLKALEEGPLSLVAAITGLHFVMAIGLSVLFFRERLSPVRLAGIALTLGAVFLLHF
ncbi:MAG TPA: DMT family transporter [Syntrophales bacterium]|nr:DMT family transporter [Syntrophales bacterium]